MRYTADAGAAIDRYYAFVNLPNGAIVTAITAYFSGGFNYDASVSMFRSNFGSSGADVGFGLASFSNKNGSQVLNGASNLPHTIDNTAGTYLVQIALTGTDAADNGQFTDVKITYTVVDVLQ